LHYSSEQERTTINKLTTISDKDRTTINQLNDH